MAKPSIVVYLEGGLVSRVIADEEVRVFIVDKDEEADDSHPTYVESMEAFVHEEDVEIEPHEVSHVEKTWETC